MDKAPKHISKGPALFTDESELAEKAAVTGRQKRITKENYATLQGNYLNLLNKAIKITNISQTRLIKTQKSLESANFRLRKFAERKHSHPIRP